MVATSVTSKHLKLRLVDDDFIGISEVGEGNKESLGVEMLEKAIFVTVLLVIQF